MAQNVAAVSERQPSLTYLPGPSEANLSGVSWAAVIGGAAVAAALSLILLALGTGLGLSSISPWADAGASASTIGAAAIVWLILMQVISSAMGGYLAGRLRTKWTSIHSDEVYFRDTAHGFLVWASGLVITAAFLASAATSMAGGAITMRAGELPLLAGPSQNEGRGSDAGGYFIDALFRSDRAGTATDNAFTRLEAGRIFANGLRHGDIFPADKTYLAQMVAATTGLSQHDAEKRVSDVFAQAQLDAEATRKAVAHISIWIFIALLIGAFCASYAATIGGRQRDHMKPI